MIIIKELTAINDLSDDWVFSLAGEKNRGTESTN